MMHGPINIRYHKQMLLRTYPSLVWSQIFSKICSTVNQRATIVESIMLSIATFWNKFLHTEQDSRESVECLWTVLSVRPLCYSQGVAASSYHVSVQHTRHLYYCGLILFITAFTECQCSVDSMPSRSPGFQHFNQLSRDVSLLQSLQADPTPSTPIPFTRPSQPTIQSYITYNTSNIVKPSKFGGYCSNTNCNIQKLRIMITQCI